MSAQLGDSTYPTSPPKRLCIMMPTWIGDACMATPTLRAIRGAYPTTEITMISRPVIQELIEDSWAPGKPWVDDYVLVTKGGSPTSNSRLGLTYTTRARQFDMAILLSNSLWSAAAMRLAGVRRIIGFNRDARGWLLTDRVPVPRAGGKRTPISAIDYYLQLARWLGCDIEDRSMQLSVCPSDVQSADQLWRQLSFSSSLPTLVINSNAATDPKRIWPAASVARVALQVAQEFKWQVLLHCGPQERDVANQLATELKHPLIGSMGVMDKLPIGLSKAVLRRAAVVLSTDSGPRHLAVAQNRRVITLYGPTDPAWTTTYNQPETAICPAADDPNLAKMADISVDRVFAAICDNINQYRLESPAVETRHAAA